MNIGTLRRLPERDDRQEVAGDWCERAFGREHTNNIPQRAVRHFEESAETAQAAGVTREMAHKLVDYVWDRPVGDISQEIGGSGLTLLALARALGISADEAEVKELNRVLSKPLEHFTARNQLKNDAGFKVEGA